MSAATDAVLIATECCTGIKQLVAKTLSNFKENGPAIHNHVAVE